MRTVDPKKLFLLRKEKYSSQEEFAGVIPMNYKTYAGKEKSGKFSSKQIKRISEILKCRPDDFTLDADVVKNIQENSMGIALENQIKMMAMQTVLLSFIAELVASQKQRSVASIQGEIKRLVNDEANSLFDELGIKR